MGESPKKRLKRVKLVNTNVRRISPAEIAAALGGKMLCPPCGRLLEKKLMTGTVTPHAPCSFPGCGCVCRDKVSN